MVDAVAFQNCREILGIPLTDIFQMGHKRHIDPEAIAAVFVTKVSRNAAMSGLKSTGLSIYEIAALLGITHQRVHQIVGETKRANSTFAHTKSIDEIRLEIWKEAVVSKDWWTSNGQRLSRAKVIDVFRKYGYQKNEAEELAVGTTISKAAMILVAAYGLPLDQHRDWINQQRYSGGKLQNEIWLEVSSKIKVGMSLMCWNRYCQSLGIYEYHTNAPTHTPTLL